MRRSEKPDLVDDGESVPLPAVVGETWASSLELSEDDGVSRAIHQATHFNKQAYLSTTLPSSMLSRDGMLGCELLVGRGVVGFAVTDDLVLAVLLLPLPLVSELTR